MHLLSLLLLACGRDPDPCVEMCAAAAPLQAACLEAGGLEWASTTYEDEQDYVERCETWAWELRLLERDAGERGAVDRVCDEREAALAAALEDPEAPDCDVLAGIDWGEMPW